MNAMPSSQRQVRSAFRIKRVRGRRWGAEVKVKGRRVVRRRMSREKREMERTCNWKGLVECGSVEGRKGCRYSVRG